MTFTISAVPATWLHAVRRDGVDDAGDRFEPFDADEDGAQLRCCLRLARAGERIALLAYRPPGTAGAYREIGPIFVHADPCQGYAERASYPTGFHGPRVVFRAYDEAGRIADAVEVEGGHAEAAIDRLFAHPDVATVHSRNVLYGCFMFTIDRR